jgi:hypothetical protein
MDDDDAQLLASVAAGDLLAFRASVSLSEFWCPPFTKLTISFAG